VSKVKRYTRRQLRAVAEKLKERQLRQNAVRGWRSRTQDERPGRRVAT
jgi:hypothetical protein